MSVYGKQAAVSVLAAMVWLTGAYAESGVAGSDVRVESGGVTASEFTRLRELGGDYSLHLVWAAEGSGAYLADGTVTILRLPERERVLEHRSQGPLTLVDLPPGRYLVRAHYNDVLPGKPDEVERTVVVPRNGTPRQLMLRFDTGDQVGADSPPELRIR